MNQRSLFKQDKKSSILPSKNVKIQVLFCMCVLTASALSFLKTTSFNVIYRRQGPWLIAVSVKHAYQLVCSFIILNATSHAVCALAWICVPCCLSVGNATCSVLSVLWICGLFRSLSALEDDMLRAVSIGCAIYCVLYQHWRCDMLCAVSA